MSNFTSVPKLYKITSKKIQLSERNNKEYEAMMVKNHSRVKGIIWRSYDKNANDPWANIHIWMTEILVLWKDKKDWEVLYYGIKNAFNLPYNIDGGVQRLLFSMEKSYVQNIWIRKQQVQEVKDLIEKYDIKESELFDKE